MIMCVHLCVCRSEVNVEYLPQSVLFVFRKGLSLNPEPIDWLD